MRIDSTPGGLAAALRMPASTVASSAAFEAVLGAINADAGARPRGGPDRLDLSATALAAMAGDGGSVEHAQLVQTLLKALSSADPQSLGFFSMRVQSLPVPAGEDLEQAVTGDMLRRVLLGTVQSADNHVLACSVALRFLPQLLSSDWGRGLPSDNPALPRFLIESDLPLLQLLGQQLKFDCVADLRGLWPLQAQLLGGLVRFGSDIDDGREAPKRRKPAPDQVGDEDEPQPEAQAQAAPQEPPDDGGPPRISAGRWAQLSVFGALKRMWWRWGSFD